MNQIRGRLLAIAGAACCLFIASLSHAQELWVEVGATRSREAVDTATDQAVRKYSQRVAFLGRQALESRYLTGRLSTPFTLPLRVVLTQNGVPLPMVSQSRAPGGDLMPTFDVGGARSFPALYQALLEDTFDAALPAMNAVYGSPKVGGVIHVRNYDADIQDRYAVGGGYYIPNGPDGPEIRFPVYFSDVGAGINYVHTLLLAYHGDAPIAIDAVSEGLVRAATMRVVRTPGSLANNPDPAVVDAALDSLYDVSAHYDWYNQPALGAAHFIAPNLLALTLPPGGSTGGIFLIRYMMAGTAWSKVLTEYPGFAAEFNARYFSDPSQYVTMDDFVALAQVVTDFLIAAPDTTVEGLLFADWAERQYIYDDETTAGVKVMLQPFPVVAQGGTADFGVFGIDVNAFRTFANGDESLLAGTAYPVFWNPGFTRMFAAVQDDEIKLAAAYGSVVPNFPFSTFGGQQYRVAVDVPFAGTVSRAVLPAGSFSTGSDPNPKNVYGTLTGLPPLVSGNYEVTVEWIGGSAGPITVQNFAFGALVSDPAFNAAQFTNVRVYSNDGINSTELFVRQVNKGVGPMALDLRSPDSYTNFATTVPARLSLAGLPLQPFRARPARVLGLSDGQTLFAQWNALTARYDLFPDTGKIMAGIGFYWRPPLDTPVSVNGFAPPHTPMTASLVAGWNAVSVPFGATLGTDDLRFTVASEAVSTYAEALGTIIGNTIFEFQPDGVNPDLGTLVPATTFSPGKGYFVRALRPEGAVMSFDPIGFTPSFAQNYSVNRREKTWEATIYAFNSAGRSTHVVIGQSSLATKGFDPRMDSELPPSPGGFQASVVTDRVLYKEILSSKEKTRFQVRLSGLRIGQTYTVSFSASGQVKRLDFKSRETGSKRLKNGSRFTFVARGTTILFEVEPEVDR